MPIAFSEFLEARFALDERSLNSTVKTAFYRALKNHQTLLCLDAGTGTGSMLNRLASADLRASIRLTAVDNQAELLAIARGKMQKQLERDGYSVNASHGQLNGKGKDRQIEITFEHHQLADYFSPPLAHRFDLITAQALMDLLSLESMLERFASGLADSGLLYTTLVYDGETTVLPLYADEKFETLLLAAYNASMEQRRVHGEKTGGAFAGRRLHRALQNTGFKIIAVGSSDWNITPLDGHYRNQDAICLSALLEMIRKEGARCADVDASLLDRWYKQRCQALEKGQLGMIIHQLDILATKVKRTA